MFNLDAVRIVNIVLFFDRYSYWLSSGSEFDIFFIWICSPAFCSLRQGNEKNPLDACIDFLGFSTLGMHTPMHWVYTCCGIHTHARTPCKICSTVTLSCHDCCKRCFFLSYFQIAMLLRELYASVWTWVLFQNINNYATKLHIKYQCCRPTRSWQKHTQCNGHWWNSHRLSVIIGEIFDWE